MKEQKKVWIPLLLSFILIIVLSGCSGVIGPKTAEINITIDPNPVPFNSEDEVWRFNLILSESNGIGVTLISLRFDAYDQEEQLIKTYIFYEEEIIDRLKFESIYISGFSALSSWIFYTWAHKYDILTVAGVDDNNNPIEATGRVDFLPQ